MKILNLKLENFQGIKSLNIDFAGKSANIYGDNATGKTTVFNAVTWLLFDKPSTGAKNFSPKTKDKNGDIHYLNHTAEASFESEEGQIFTLKKDFHEIYKKRNGSTNKEFSGHSVDFYIDGVPVKEKDYLSKLSEYFGDNETMKMLTMTNYFSEIITWDTRRKILLQICGNITDQEVINSSDELAELNDILLVQGTFDKYYTVDEYKKIALNSKTKINKIIDEIPSRIDEAQRMLPDIKNTDIKVIQSKIDELMAKENEMKEAKSNILNDSSNKITELINNAKTRLSSARAEYAMANSKTNESTYQQINEINKLNMERKNAVELNKNEIIKTESKIKHLEQLRQSFLDEYNKISAEVFDESKSICPTCNRALPDEEIERIKGEFENKKIERLNAINEKGKSQASREMIGAEKEKLLALNQKVEDGTKIIEQYKQQLEELKKQVKEEIPFESTKEYADLQKEIKELNENGRAGNEQINESIKRYENQIKAIQNEIAEQMSIKSKIDLYNQQQKRIDELKEQEKTYSSQYEQLEKNIYLCDLFVKTKVKMLTEKINSKFKTVRFRLFVEQQNGGIKEDCEVMIPSDSGSLVPFSFANNAARINAGLEIINTLSKHCNMKMPIFIDNAESVTSFLDIDSQVIKLIVSEKDKELRVEKETQEVCKYTANF